MSEDNKKWKSITEGTPLIPENSEILESLGTLKKMIQSQIDQDLNKIQELRETLHKVKRGGTKSS